MLYIEFNAMGRCGVGLRCFDKVQGSLWVKDMTDPKYLFRQNHDFQAVENEIKKNTLGQLQAAITNVWSGKSNQELTCLFNHDLIQRTPVGPRVTPLKCPSILRDFFYRKVNDLNDDFKLQVGFYSDEPQQTLMNQ